VTSPTPSRSRFPGTIVPGDKVSYGPQDRAHAEPARDIGEPGEYPFTRGPYKTMYRGKVWTMRMFSGFGTAADTNKRFLYLLEHGQTGLSTAFDMPTLMGYDSDHARSRGEVGREGVAVCTLENMETLFRGIPLGEVSTSMTINSTAMIMLAFYIATAERQGVPPDRLRGTIQNDILKEYIAQKEWIFPPLPSMRIITDMMAFCADHVPKWNTISVSGYHIREAGSTALQELAFTLMDGFTYVEFGIRAGIPVDKFAPRLSFFFNSHMNFFEEIAKFRAARRIWARRLKERYGAKNPESWRLRFHTQTAGCSLTAQQPENNIVRTAVEALGGRPGRDAIPPHELDGRGAGASDRGGRQGRAPHPADPGPRVGPDRARGPARRGRISSNPSRTAWKPSARRSSRNRAARRHGCGHRAGIPAARDRESLLPVPEGRGGAAVHQRRRERLRGEG
jgi:methylmalonyl-CoA mutase cobalamin-binding domain/chain